MDWSAINVNSYTVHFLVHPVQDCWEIRTDGGESITDQSPSPPASRVTTPTNPATRLIEWTQVNLGSVIPRFVSSFAQSIIKAIESLNNGHHVKQDTNDPKHSLDEFNILEELQTLEARQFLLALLSLGRKEGAMDQNEKGQYANPPSRSALKWIIFDWTISILALIPSFQNRELFLPAYITRLVAVMEEASVISSPIPHQTGTFPLSKERASLITDHIACLIWSWIDLSAEKHHRYSVVAAFEALATNVTTAHCRFTKPLVSLLTDRLLVESYIMYNSPPASATPSLGVSNSNYQQPPQETDRIAIGESSGQLPFYLEIFRNTEIIISSIITSSSPDVTELFAVLWALDWKEWLQVLMNSSDDSSTDSIDIFLSPLIKTSVSCVKVQPDLLEPFTQILIELLEDCAEIYTDIVRLDIYILVIDVFYQLFTLQHEKNSHSSIPVYASSPSLRTSLASGELVGSTEVNQEFDILDIFSQLFTTPCAPMLYIADSALQGYFRYHACCTFARCLKELDDMVTARDYLFSFSNELHSIMAKDKGRKPSTEEHFKIASTDGIEAIDDASESLHSSGLKLPRMLITLITCICEKLLLPDEVVLSLALPALFRRIEVGDDVEFDLIYLMDIALSNVSAFQEVLDYLLLEPLQKNYKYLSILAHGSADDSRYAMILLGALLGLFNDLAAKSPLPTTLYAKHAYLASQLFDVASLIAVLCNGQGIPELHTTESQGVADGKDPTNVHDTFLKNFHDFWFSCTLFALNPVGGWSASWYTCLSVIARKSPRLVPSSNVRMVEIDLKANTILGNMDIISASVNYAKIPKLLRSAFPESRQSFFDMPTIVMVYVYTVHQLECFRRSSIALLFAYLEHPALKVSPLQCFIQDTCSQVFDLLMSDSPSTIEQVCRPLLCDTDSSTEVIKFSKLNLSRSFDKLQPAISWDFALFRRLFKFHQTCLRTSASDLKVINSVALLADASTSLQDNLSLCQHLLGLWRVKNPHAYRLMLTQFVTECSLSETPIPTQLDGADVDVGMLCKQAWYLGHTVGSSEQHAISSARLPSSSISELYVAYVTDMLATASAYQSASRDIKTMGELCDFLFKVASTLHVNRSRGVTDARLLQFVVTRPVENLDEIGLLRMAIPIWEWLYPFQSVMIPIMIENWRRHITSRREIYDTSLTLHPFSAVMDNSPSKPVNSKFHRPSVTFIWLGYLISSAKIAIESQQESDVFLYSKLFSLMADNKDQMCGHWSWCSGWFSMCIFGGVLATALLSKDAPISESTAKVQLSNHKQKAQNLVPQLPSEGLALWERVFYLAIHWFQFPLVYGEFDAQALETVKTFLSIVGRLFAKFCPSPLSHQKIMLENLVVSPLEEQLTILILLLRFEIDRISLILDPLSRSISETQLTRVTAKTWRYYVPLLYKYSPAVAMGLKIRFVSFATEICRELTPRVLKNPSAVLHIPETAQYFIRSGDPETLDLIAPTSSITALHYLTLPGDVSPHLQAYAKRSLDSKSVDEIFFYIPQLIQALHYDKQSGGTIQRYLLEESAISQLFAHQIIWNMKANMFEVDEEGTLLANLVAKIITNFTPEDRGFYEKEFAFFKSVTDISGKLKPLVAADATKMEKKKKIDQEMRKIKVLPGVYLPTDPKSFVVDMDVDSGRPLQSHAKAPFMATFKVRDEVGCESWMSCIFKVGDDCRQDVLALQLISVFKGIFEQCNLDVYLFPYKVVATEPGCGVIQVIPRSISRDMMGREKVNSLKDWFEFEFGGPTTEAFARARHEFIKSLAASSILMFILQIKDRHNGNIMFDKEGHMLYIDFGFMLSIAPGGGVLEVAPFKLTGEMLQVLGGDNSPYFVQFMELLVKCYLAVRPFAQEIIAMVELCMRSGLPCFKGESTIRKLRDRFQLGKTDAQAAEFMKGCIKESKENTRSGLYDRFQFLQNGIPFRK